MSYRKPPPKPRRMSEKTYRKLYDSDPCTVLVSRQGRVDRLRCSGAVSAEVLAGTFRRQGHNVKIVKERGSDA